MPTRSLVGTGNFFAFTLLGLCDFSMISGMYVINFYSTSFQSNRTCVHYDLVGHFVFFLFYC